MVAFCVAHMMLRRDLQWCHGVLVVSWLDRGGIDHGFPLSINELLVTKMWQLLRGRLLQVTQLSCGRDQVGQVTILE